jgi:flagellar protein FlaF
MHSAAQAYGKIAKQIASPRNLEADLLLKAAARLQAIHEGWDEKQFELKDALMYNRKLWSIFVTALTEPTHPMPAPIRQNVANLGLFVMKQTVIAMQEPRREMLPSMININRQVAAGLRGQG